MRVHRVLSRPDQTIVSRVETREAKLEFTTRTLEQTRPAPEQLVFNEAQYLAMIETLGFLNEKAEKEVLNLNKITKTPKEEAARIEQRARALRSHVALPNLLLTEHKEEVRGVAARYESGIGRMKQLITAKRSALAEIGERVAELRVANGELADRIQDVDRASLELNLLPGRRVGEDAKRQIYNDFDQLLLVARQKHGLLGQRLESLEAEQATLGGRLVFLGEELRAARRESEANGTQTTDSATAKRKLEEEVAALTTRIAAVNEEIAQITVEVDKAKEFVRGFAAVKAKLDAQIRDLMRQISDAAESGPSAAEQMLSREIGACGPKLLDLRARIVAVEVEASSLENCTADAEETLAHRDEELHACMDDCDAQDALRRNNEATVELLKQEVRELRRQIEPVDYLYAEMAEIVAETRAHEVELVERYNQKKDQLRIAFQTAKVCANDALKEQDLQLSTLRKLIADQLAKRRQKETALDGLTKQPDFDWQRLTALVDVQKRIAATKTAMVAVRGGNAQMLRQALEDTAADYGVRRAKLQEEVAKLKRSVVAYDAEHRVTYDLKQYDYEARVARLQELVAKRKESVAKLEAVAALISNNSVLLNPEGTTLELKFESTHKRQLEFQNKEIDELRQVLNEYSSD